MSSGPNPTIITQMFNYFIDAEVGKQYDLDNLYWQKMVIHIPVQTR